MFNLRGQVLKIGLLEWGYREKLDSLTAIQQVLDYACTADELGFSRFWLTEHHNPNKLAPFTNPDILIALIAGMTSDIKVGAAGILVKMHSSYSVATNYKLLNNLYPDRIDLGLARSDPGSEYLRGNLYDRSNKALSKEKIIEIYGFLHHEGENFEKDGVVIPPFGGVIPKLWYLTRSYFDTEIAISHQLNLCRSIMHGKQAQCSQPQKEELYVFKSRFLEINKFEAEVCLAIAIIMGDNLEDAQKKVDTLALENPDDNSIQPLAVTAKSLYNLLNDYQEIYGINEFILYDFEGENLKRIENLRKISSSFRLNREHNLKVSLHQH